MAGGMIDVHFHMIPEFYRDAVYEAGTGPAIGRYPDWTPQLAIELLDKHGIALAVLSLGQPGVGFLPAGKASAFARRCNDYAAELIAQHPRRFGCFGWVKIPRSYPRLLCRSVGKRIVARSFPPPLPTQATVSVSG